MKRVLIAGVIVIVSLAAFFAYRSLFGERVSFETTSNSPDGMYRCEVRETVTSDQCRVVIKVFRREGAGDEPWRLIKEEEISNDSACRSNYSVDWQYGEQRQTEGLVVFGDFGSPPFPGQVILEMGLGPDAHRVTKDEAVKLVMKLPEVRAWDAFIRAKTNDLVHGAAMLAADSSEEMSGFDCWRVAFGENQPERFYLWQEFAVSIATGKVFLIVHNDDGLQLHGITGAGLLGS